MENGETGRRLAVMEGWMDGGVRNERYGFFMVYNLMCISAMYNKEEESKMEVKSEK